MDIYIKNMVCIRCKMIVQTILDALDIQYEEIFLGRVRINHDIPTSQFKKLASALEYYHLELLEDRKKIVVSRIKSVILELFQGDELELNVKFPEYLSKRLHYDYTYLANIFSETEGTTIEKFYILARIEKAKELIVYYDISLKEISYLLNFSSLSHLCIQFKKVTGETPSRFRKSCLSETVVWRKCE